MRWSLQLRSLKGRRGEARLWPPLAAASPQPMKFAFMAFSAFLLRSLPLQLFRLLHFLDLHTVSGTFLLIFLIFSFLSFPPPPFPFTLLLLLLLCLPSSSSSLLFLLVLLLLPLSSQRPCRSAGRGGGAGAVGTSDGSSRPARPQLC